MDKIRDFFIGRYLGEEVDLFEKARALMFYRFLVAFSILFILPVFTDYSLDLYKLLIKHSFDSVVIIVLLFSLRFSKSIDQLISYFFTYSFFSYLLAFMMLNPEKMDTIAIIWSTFFFALSALLQKGKARILYCCLLGWIPILYVLVNIQLKGLLTIDSITERLIGEPPIFLMFIPIILIIISIWSHTNTIQDARVIISMQKKLLQEKNTNITDSITYAKRIQQSKLPQLDEFTSLFSHSFILFKPKDIVSGDFYYFQKSNDKVYIAAADCTGHGVPGAIMSMICSEKLEEAISQFEDTAEILSSVNKNVRTSLKQSENNQSTKDGMDIALCAVDIKNRILRYSGANRPLWIIRQGSSIVEEIKPTKAAIGGYTHDSQCFEKNEISLHEGDTFYIFTDGYADQFNGRTEKKLMSKRMKEILIQIQTKTMIEQEKYLNSFIEDWKSDTEQVDDILVIGVRI